MNAIELRNLQEQVLKNKDDILKHFQRDEVLADFGIRIIGQVETEEELNAIPTEDLEYGDAYAVGAQSPFNYYIWTRANNINPNDYWFAFGEIAIVGPQGPKGDTVVGPKGETGQSTRWYLYSDAQWNYPSDKNPGDMALTYPSGNVYIMGENGTWDGQGNIRGPIGKTGNTGRPFTFADFTPEQLERLRGPKGDTGDVGGFINIAGVLVNEYDLPDPSLINNLTVAYLVGTMEPYTLYIQVGSTSRNAEWVDMGPLNVATMVTVNGQYQNTWNADTKVDKIPLSQTAGTIAYTRDHLGVEGCRGISASPINAGGSIPVYNWSSTGESVLKTGAPEAYDDCVNKEYADNTYTKKTSLFDIAIQWGNTVTIDLDGIGNDGTTPHTMLLSGFLYYYADELDKIIYIPLSTTTMLNVGDTSIYPVSAKVYSTIDETPIGYAYLKDVQVVYEILSSNELNITVLQPDNIDGSHEGREIEANLFINWLN